MTSIHSETVARRLPRAVTPELIARLAGLDVRARTIVEGFVAGLHRSPQHGFSVDLPEQMAGA